MAPKEATKLQNMYLFPIHLKEGALTKWCLTVCKSSDPINIYTGSEVKGTFKV